MQLNLIDNFWQSSRGKTMLREAQRWYHWAKVLKKKIHSVYKPGYQIVTRRTLKKNKQKFNPYKHDHAFVNKKLEWAWMRERLHVADFLFNLPQPDRYSIEELGRMYKWHDQHPKMGEYGRWHYWCCLRMINGFSLVTAMEDWDRAARAGQRYEVSDFLIDQEIPDIPIPQIEWHKSDLVHKMLEECFRAIAPHGNFENYFSQSLNYFLDWFLYSVGHPSVRELPEEPTKNAAISLYQLFDLELMLAYPWDYFGEFISEYGSKANKYQAFYPTPMVVTQAMTDIQFHDFYAEIPPDDPLARKKQMVKSVGDPCCGTGATLLAASNHILQGYGNDIDPELVRACLLQCYLYAPWFATPAWWLGKSDLTCGDTLAQDRFESMNLYHWVEYLNETGLLIFSDSTNAPSLGTSKAQKLEQPEKCVPDKFTVPDIELTEERKKRFQREFEEIKKSHQ